MLRKECLLKDYNYYDQVYATRFTEYPGHIGGRCADSFDCDPNGPRVCVTLIAVRDCFADCPNAADEGRA